MKKTAPIVFALILLASQRLLGCQVWAQPAFQIGLPLSGQVQSSNGYILQFGIMEEATAVPPAPTTTITTTTITTTTISPTVTTTILTSSTSLTTSTIATTTTTLPSEPAPEIKVWFDNRLYQSTLTDKGNEFIVSKRPKIKVEFTLPAPYALSPKKTYQAARPMSAQAAGSSAIEYTLQEDLPPGTHTFSFTASTAGTKGRATSSTQSITVVVKAGAIAVLGEPIHFPSPFSPTKNKDGITMQYTLSENADIDIYVFNVAGETAKRITCFAGTEGGMAGLNQVKWNGLLDGGGMIGNGIYATTIISKKEGKLLAKFKINVFD